MASLVTSSMSDLAIKQSPQNIPSTSIFDQLSQPEYASIDMIHMSHSFQYLYYYQVGHYQ
jgi:hypothetical protein